MPSRAFVTACLSALLIGASAHGQTVWNSYTAAQLLQLGEAGDEASLTAYVVGAADGMHQLERISAASPATIPRDAVACIPYDTSAKRLGNVARKQLQDFKAHGVDLANLPGWVAVSGAFIIEWPCRASTAPLK